MPKGKVIYKAVTWLSEEISNDKKIFSFFHYYPKFQFKNIVGEIGDFVLISNADAAEPGTEGGCDAAKILDLYEDQSNRSGPFRAKVQWYFRPSDLPKGCLSTSDPISFYDKEVVEDHRPSDTDISIETIFRKCEIILTVTKDVDYILGGPYQYVCRYRLMPVGRKKCYLEPVLEDERNASLLLATPSSAKPLSLVLI